MPLKSPFVVTETAKIWYYIMELHYVTAHDHVVRCRGSQECGSRNVNFACGFHGWSRGVRVALGSAAFFFVRSWNGNRDNGASDIWTLTAYCLELLGGGGGVSVILINNCVLDLQRLFIVLFCVSLEYYNLW